MPAEATISPACETSIAGDGLQLTAETRAVQNFKNALYGLP